MSDLKTEYLEAVIQFADDEGYPVTSAKAKEELDILLERLHKLTLQNESFHADQEKRLEQAWAAPRQCVCGELIR